MRLAVISDISVKWVGVLSAAIAATYALWELNELNQKRVDERKLQTIEFARQFASRDLFTIRRNVYRHFIECEKDCDSIDIDNSQVFAFVEFFDMVYACIQAGTCDEGLARDFFTPYANGHWHCMKPFIVRTRASEPGSTSAIHFGIGLEMLKNWDKPIGPCGVRPNR